MNKKKACKGIGKANGFNSCGVETYYRKYGLCPDCFKLWYNENKNIESKSNNKTEIKRTKRIKPISDKRKEENKIYSKLRIDFLSQPQNKKCPITGKPTTDIHHMKGRIGKLLNDTTYWIALSREGHRYVEDNPKWAKENGYTLHRLT